MKKTLILSSIILTALFTGCVNVPQTRITGSLGGQPFSFNCPKDSDVTGLHIGTGTNGTLSLDIKTMSVRMNPEVITTTGDAQVKLVNAVGAQVQAAMALAK